MERVGVDTLLRSGVRGPLSLERVREELPELLDGGDRGPAQRHRLMLRVALSGLRGLTYAIQGLRRDRPVTGVTFADWKDFRLEPGGGVRQLLRPAGSSPLETVLASASHPGAFAPSVLDRRQGQGRVRAAGHLEPAALGLAVVLRPAPQRLRLGLRDHAGLVLRRPRRLRPAG